VALDHSQGVRLARALRQLRESTWPDRAVTQAQLAKALSSEGPVAAATVSSWESKTNPKTPPSIRLSAYARFFSTERSLEGQPHLVPKDQLTSSELERFQLLESQLLQILQPDDRKLERIFQFDEGPVIVICSTAPEDVRGPLANEKDPNFTKLQQYADQDALIELYGHLRAANPSLDVFHRIPMEVVADDISKHVILLGGIGWNKITSRFQRAVRQMPIKQINVDDLPTGEIFQVDPPDDGKPKLFYPEFDDLGDGNELIADVGYLARLRNPFQVSRTLTICNGIHSRGVLGAVRCLTDVSVRENNEKYLADKFPDGEFAMLIRVQVVAGETVSPELANPDVRLYEWSPNQDDLL
jgi:hypothetical protein